MLGLGTRKTGHMEGTLLAEQGDRTDGDPAATPVGTDAKGQGTIRAFWSAEAEPLSSLVFAWARASPRRYSNWYTVPRHYMTLVILYRKIQRGA